MGDLENLLAELSKRKNAKKAEKYARFFKTGRGQYGEGDAFFGLTVPEQRKIAKKYLNLSLENIKKLLIKRYHECRLIGLIILGHQFKNKGKSEREKIFRFYLKNIKYINNWDLVDISAPAIVGQYLSDKDHSLLERLAKSKRLWEKRIAVMATLAFIKNGQFADSLKIIKMLLSDRHDLIQKAAGWMLREIGKRDREAEEKFLLKYASQMPRTMLRYAIEKFPEPARKKYLGMKAG